MHCQCHFGKVNSSSCSSVDTAGVRLRYIMGQKVMAIIWAQHAAQHSVFAPPRFYLWKSTILVCIRIPQLDLVNWRCYKFYIAS